MTSLATRDKHLDKIKDMIHQKKMLIVSKTKDLSKKEKLNEFLTEVKGDYMKYYNHIVNEKQQQYKALSLLKEYVGDLMQTEKMVDSQLRSANHDHKDIIQEIDKVKYELDELIGSNV